MTWHVSDKQRPTKPGARAYGGLDFFCRRLHSDCVLRNYPIREKPRTHIHPGAATAAAMIEPELDSTKATAATARTQILSTRGLSLRSSPVLPLLSRFCPLCLPILPKRCPCITRCWLCYHWWPHKCLIDVVDASHYLCMSRGWTHAWQGDQPLEVQYLGILWPCMEAGVRCAGGGGWPCSV
jgi:hypothetical protein